MAKRPKATRRVAGEGGRGLEVKLEAGRFSFGKLFTGVGNLLDLALRLQAEGKDEYREERVYRGKTSTGKDVRAVLGFSVRTAAGLAKKRAAGAPAGEAKGQAEGTKQGTAQPT
jgi:hypothetical protein